MAEEKGEEIDTADWEEAALDEVWEKRARAKAAAKKDGNDPGKPPAPEEGK